MFHSKRLLNINPTKNLLVIAGVHKAGTTSLHSYLGRHNEICSGIKKEIHYYTPLRYGGEPQNISYYLNQFRSCKNEKYYLDASPSYLYGRNIIANKIKTDFNCAKIIVILRDPTDRFISFYKFLKANFQIKYNVTFMQFFEKSYSLRNKPEQDELFHRAFREGCYAFYLEDWFKIFGDSLKIIYFENLKSDPKAIMREICNWLDLDSSIYEDVSIFNVRNKTRNSSIQVIYNVASSINSKYEMFFRKHPTLKNYLNKLYFFINENKTTEIINEKEILLIKKYYESENRKLIELLHNFNYYNLPNW